MFVPLLFYEIALLPCQPHCKINLIIKLSSTYDLTPVIGLLPVATFAQTNAISSLPIP